MKIGCFETVDGVPLDKNLIIHFSEKLIKLENPILDGEIKIIFVDNSKIHSLNKEYLNHDYPTDVISFPIEEQQNFLEGEIYISLNKAFENAKSYKVSLNEEIWRLIIHGLLHFLGFDDKNEKQRELMTKKVNFYLKKIKLFEKEKD